MHGTIAGMTMSGKTFLAQRLAAKFKRSRIQTLILRRPGEAWPADAVSWSTEDPDAFLAMFGRARGCACFLELADADVGHTDKRFHACFSKGRHLGHRCYFLSQRAAQVHPTIRENCTELYLFTSGAKGAAIWAEEFADDAILKAATLPRFSFIHKPTRFDQAVTYPRLKV